MSGSPDPPSAQRRRRVSLEGRLALWVGALVLSAVAAALLAEWLLADAWLAGLLAGAIGVVLTVLVVRWWTAPSLALFRALSGAVASFRDNDFSTSVHYRRDDELGDLVAEHNALARVLREERQNLFQRELLLDTVVQNTPVALVLTEPRGHVVYANLAARQLFNDGRRLDGQLFAERLAEAPLPLREAVATGGDRLFGFEHEGAEETFHLSRREFRLNGRPHTLHLFKRLTQELSRQEVQTWKKVIRVISHELNNSLAPISSMAHSGAELLRRGEHGRLERVFAAIEERARHLDGFIRGYARFAKLPAPQLEAVSWAPFLQRIEAHYPFRIDGELPEAPARFDPAQLEQVLINLLKNAHEAGSPDGEVSIAVTALPGRVRIDVADRGEGMSEAVLANALVPFYSTKRSGTGLGLALAREILEAHGGRISLANRDGGGLLVSLFLPA
jgi:nitrogen fixation/metabolism regulation signal transduction histidine kinase